MCTFMLLIIYLFLFYSCFDGLGKIWGLLIIWLSYIQLFVVYQIRIYIFESNPLVLCFFPCQFILTQMDKIVGIKVSY